MIGAPTLPPHYTLDDLERLNNHSAYYDSQASYTSIREKALREAGQALGMQSALHYESTQINQILSATAPQLDQVFDFNQVMYQDNVMPPVLDKASNLVNINPSGDTLRIAGITYNIVLPARFVTAPPTWRDYLWLSYPRPNFPDKSLLPENKKEQAVWQANVDLGWNEGMHQAVSIFKINLSVLVRDFNGMLLYKELLLQNMVSPYYVNHIESGITGDSKHMVVDDQLMQITAQPELLYQSQRWDAMPVSLKPAPLPPAVAAPEKPLAKPASLADALEKVVQSNAISK